LTASRTDRATALDRAAEHLRSAGLRVLDRDWQQADGTLDIVAVHNGVLVACVLTSRRPPRASQARQKLARSLAARWMQAHGLRYARVRVDLIGHGHGPEGHRIEHVREVA
jgi:putative endonuclease